MVSRSTIAALVFASFACLPVSGLAQVSSSQVLTPTQQAAYGWTWAQQAAKECSNKIGWNSATGEPIKTNDAIKLLVSEGHRRNKVIRAFRESGSYPFIQLDRWLVSAGYKPNAQNIDALFCEFSGKVAGTSHPMGRFIKRK
ncbi:MAG: hypothetical protein AAGF36_14300 [Pseudomonadota bacterium]